MSDVEDLVRATLLNHADDAPTPERLAESVRARRRRSRRTRQALTVVAVAAATAAAVVIPLTLTASGHEGSKDVTAPKPKPPAEQVIGFHGIEITVPASWKMNDLRCGTPVADTVIRDTGGTQLCLVPRPPNVNSVELLPNSSMVKSIRESTGITNAHGVHLLRGRAGSDIGIVVPAVGVIAFVHTITTSLADRIIDSIDITRVDSSGCKMREFQLQPPFSATVLRGPYNPYVIYPGATSVAICHYEDNWLVSSAMATGTQLTNIVREANTARGGFAHARPADYAESICAEPASRGGEAGSGYILLARNADGATQRLWAHIGSCGPLGITNGQRAGRLSLQLAQAINAPLHSGFSIPGRLLPGPPP